MLSYFLSGGEDLRIFFLQLLMSLPIILFALSIHEAAHGFVAYKMGDPTARNLGRLTINPLKHLDLFGSLCMLLFGFGWAKPVPINTRNFKNPRKGMALSALAGPVANLLTAVVSAFLFVLVNFIFTKTGIPSYGVYIVYLSFYYLFYFGTVLNVTLAIFNLIPIPPFDGSRIAYVFLPPKYYFGVMKYERYIQMGFFAILLVFSYLNISLLSYVTDPIVDGLISLFSLIFFR